MKNIAILFFTVMCLAQWLVPGKMIYDSERVITDGTLYKFKTVPIDPSDPFRGKYITLNFEANSIALSDSADWQQGEEIFITFTTDSAGFAKAETISRVAPASGNYLLTTVNYTTANERLEVFFTLPFDRFYLEESKASQAEQLYWQAQGDSTQVAYGLVSIGAGRAVLQDVIINERSIVEVIRELNADSR